MKTNSTNQLAPTRSNITLMYGDYIVNSIDIDPIRYCNRFEVANLMIRAGYDLFFIRNGDISMIINYARSLIA